MGSPNYFAGEAVAARYARFRPVYQPRMIQQIRETLQIAEPVCQALDVGCGTGNSTRALAAIARHVVGTDAARGMLAAAAPRAGVEYVEARAEQLPFAEETFDLATVSSAFHWFDRRHFLPEAWRVLRPGGWLAIYTTGFTGQMRENPAYQQWQREVYRLRYPSPPRSNQPLTDDEAAWYGFPRVLRENVAYEVTFSVEEFAGNLTTHSNVVAAIERGGESLDEIHAWLITSLRPLFPSPCCTFVYDGTITYLQKPDAGPGR